MLARNALGLAVSLAVHALLLLVATLPGAAPVPDRVRSALDTVAVAFVDEPPPPPRPAPRLVVGEGAEAQGQGQPVRRAPVRRVPESTKPAVVDRPAPKPSTPARSRPAPRTAPPAETPRATRSTTRDRIPPSGTPDVPPSTKPPGVGATDRPDADPDGGGTTGRPSTRDVDGGSPTGRGTGRGEEGTGGDPARGAGTGAFSVEGLGNRRLVRRVLPTNDEGLTLTLAAEIVVAPNGSVRLGRWVQRGNPRLQREAETALRAWRFAPLPSGAPQEAQRGVVRFRFVAR